jgi:hypothetical protein
VWAEVARAAHRLYDRGRRGARRRRDVAEANRATHERSDVFHGNTNLIELSDKTADRAERSPQNVMAG